VTVRAYLGRTRKLLRGLRRRIGSDVPIRRDVTCSLAVMDDIFPLGLSGFRYLEFTALLREFPDVLALSTGTAIPSLDRSLDLKSTVARFRDERPELADRIVPVEGRFRLNADLAYMVFLQNANTFLPLLEENGVPFVFTLYPGGGFVLNDPECDRTLARVLGSSCLRKVIVTQPLTHEYLLDRRFCDPARIAYIYGGVFQVARDSEGDGPDASGSSPKPEDGLNVCFVAHKYSARGYDKGYDVFVAVARELSERYSDITFHVVGDFAPDDVELGPARDRFVFYGQREPEFFGPFYRTMHIIVSPNRPFVFPGKFDGFPTGCCIEAGAAGVAVFCTDELDQNRSFVPGTEIEIINLDVGETVLRLERYYHDRSALTALAARCRERFLAEFDLETQLRRRFDIINAELERRTGEAPRALDDAARPHRARRAVETIEE
jgi:glycosyltransferase involved in cell wall biosynthesis